MDEPIKQHKKILLQGAGIMTFAIALGYPLSYLRDMLIVRQFGAAGATDAWITASIIPELCYKLLMFGALGNTFIPVFTQYLIQKNEDEAWKVASTVINASMILLAAVTALAMVKTDALVRLIAPGFSGPTFRLTVDLTRIVLPVILFTGMMGLLTAIYRVYLRFAVPSVGTLLGPCVVIVFIVALSGREGIFSLAYGTLAGAFVSLLVIGFFFFLRHPLYRPTIDLKHPAIRSIFFLMAPLVGADLLGKGSGVIFRIFASFLPQGSITAFALAYRVFSIPVLVFSSAVASAIFPLLSRQHAEAQSDDFKDTLLLGMRMMCILLVPIAVGFIVLKEPLIRVLFERGLFDRTATVLTAQALVYLSFGLLAFGINPLLSQSCYAMKKNWFLFRYELIGLCLAVPLNLMLIRRMGLAGLALGTATIRIVLVGYLFCALHRQLKGFDLRVLGETVVKVIVASVLMGGVCYAAYQFSGTLPGSSGFLHQFVRLTATTAVSAGIYYFLLLGFQETAVTRVQNIIVGKIFRR